MFRIVADFANHFKSAGRGRSTYLQARDFFEEELAERHWTKGKLNRYFYWKDRLKNEYKESGKWKIVKVTKHIIIATPDENLWNMLEWVQIYRLCLDCFAFMVHRYKRCIVVIMSVKFSCTPMLGCTAQDHSWVAIWYCVILKKLTFNFSLGKLDGSFFKSRNFNWSQCIINVY